MKVREYNSVTGRGSVVVQMGVSFQDIGDDDADVSGSFDVVFPFYCGPSDDGPVCELLPFHLEYYEVIGSFSSINRLSQSTVAALLGLPPHLFYLNLGRRIARLLVKEGLI